MEEKQLSGKYSVRRLNKIDTDHILALCVKNELFYQYHPPLADRESILKDMSALPPDKTEEDKFYVGFYREEKLTAVLDLILSYPQKQTAYIGFFMMDVSCQGQGIGSCIIADIAACLKSYGFEKIRLAVDEGNPQSEYFWRKNHFVRTGERIPNDFSAYLPMERELF